MRKIPWGSSFQNPSSLMATGIPASWGRCLKRSKSRSEWYNFSVMDTPKPSISAHPKGEPKNTSKPPTGSWPLDTPGGRFHAEWDDQAPVTREGQLVFFFQFLQAGGRWLEFLRECPLHDVGNRGSGADHIMGTVLLSVLSGHWRYAHINGVRGDGINPGLLGLRGTVSEDAVRLAMYRIEEAARCSLLYRLKTPRC